MLVEVSDERDLLDNVLLHFRDAVKEEEGEDTGHTAEASKKGNPARACQSLPSGAA